MGLLSERSHEVLEALYIGKWMTGQEILADAQQVPEGTLYTTLLRLEQDGFVELQWVEKANRRGRRGRRYRITVKGQKITEAARAASMVMNGVRI